MLHTITDRALVIINNNTTIVDISSSLCLKHKKDNEEWRELMREEGKIRKKPAVTFTF